MKNHSRKWQNETHIDDDRPLTVGIPVKLITIQGNPAGSRQSQTT